MIKQIEKFEEINGVESPLIPRIFSAFKYKNHSDNAWEQLNDNGETIALLSSVDGNITLITTENTDFCEIKEFLAFFGCNSVVSDVPMSTSAKSYALFKFNGDKLLENEFNYCALNSASTADEYREFHSILFADERRDFDFWYCDFSKKVVNNDAKAICLKQGENLVSIATAPLIYKNTAIISGVYTLETFRNKGFSKATIKKIIEELNKDNVTEIYLWCEKDLEDFYNKLGFENVGNIYMEMELQNELF